jgi:hypothetical protein
MGLAISTTGNNHGGISPNSDFPNPSTRYICKKVEVKEENGVEKNICYECSKFHFEPKYVTEWELIWLGMRKKKFTLSEYTASTLDRLSQDELISLKKQGSDVRVFTSKDKI